VTLISIAKALGGNVSCARSLRGYACNKYIRFRRATRNMAVQWAWHSEPARRDGSLLSRVPAGSYVHAAFPP